MRSVTLSNEILLPEVAKLLSEGSEVTIRAKGNSMLPFIKGDRDSVVLKKEEVYRMGDIVLAEISPKLFVLHRIIKISEGKVALMGDGNISKTEECLLDNIYGRAIAIIRKGRLVDCNSKTSLRSARVWGRLLPLRRYILAIYTRLT